MTGQRIRRWCSKLALCTLPLLLAGCVQSMFYYPDDVRYETPDALGVRYEPVQFTSADGTRLSGWFLPAEGRAVVEGLNMVQRHTRASQSDPQGGIKHKEASVHVSNVAVADSKGKPTRVGFRVDGDKKVRVAKTTGEVING